MFQCFCIHLRNFAFIRFENECKVYQSNANILRGNAKHCERKQKLWNIIFPPSSYFFPSPCPFRRSVWGHPEYVIFAYMWFPLSYLFRKCRIDFSSKVIDESWFFCENICTQILRTNTCVKILQQFFVKFLVNNFWITFAISVTFSKLY